MRIDGEPDDVSRLPLEAIGEFGLIDLLIAGPLKYDDDDARIALGPGDDAAAWLPTPNTATIITTDTMVEDIHFRLSTTGWFDLGWKAMAMNVSDVAAMGGLPRFALVTVGLTTSVPVGAVVDLYRGMRALADQFGVRIIGGDTVSSSHILVSVTVTGESLSGESGAEAGPAFIRRSAAQPGDLILVTGTLGMSAAGLRVLEGGERADSACAQHAIMAHRRPIPRVREAQFLLRHGVRAGADNSDGLLKQVALFCKASHVGATIDCRLLPLDPCLKALFPRDYVDLALTGGESYELVLTATADALSRVRGTWDHAFALPLVEIGSVVGHDIGLKVIDFEGNVRDASNRQQGFDHFSFAGARSG